MTPRQKKEVEYKKKWAKKSICLIKKEIKSFERYFKKNEAYYNFHGKNETHPDELSDGDRIRILKELMASDA